MAVINLTPHLVVVMPFGGDTVSFDPTGPVARVREVVSDPKMLSTSAGVVPIRTVAYAPVIDGLPDPQPDTLYLVSRITAAATNRGDVVFPQGELRNDAGHIIGCAALGRFDRLERLDA